MPVIIQNFYEEAAKLFFQKYEMHATALTWFYSLISSQTCHISNKQKVPKCWWVVFFYWEGKQNKTKPRATIYNSQHTSSSWIGSSISNIIKWLNAYYLQLQRATSYCRISRNCFYFREVTLEKFAKGSWSARSHNIPGTRRIDFTQIILHMTPWYLNPLFAFSYIWIFFMVDYNRTSSLTSGLLKTWKVHFLVSGPSCLKFIFLGFTSATIFFRERCVFTSCLILSV